MLSRSSLYTTREQVLQTRIILGQDYVLFSFTSTFSNIPGHESFRTERQGAFSEFILLLRSYILNYYYFSQVFEIRHYFQKILSKVSYYSHDMCHGDEILKCTKCFNVNLQTNQRLYSLSK